MCLKFARVRIKVDKSVHLKAVLVYMTGIKTVRKRKQAGTVLKQWSSITFCTLVKSSTCSRHCDDEGALVVGRGVAAVAVAVEVAHVAAIPLMEVLSVHVGDNH